jgi:type IX secretion system PorP/SprF family membrane protein
MKKLLGILFLGSTFGAMAQSADNPGQYVVHLPLVNPAAIVQKQSMNGALFYKQQWVGFEGAPANLFANFNMPLHAANSFVGATLENNSIGVTNRFKFRGIYAYKVTLSDNSYFSLALNPGIESLQSNFDEVKTDYENDPLFGGQAVNMTSFNSGFGAYYYASKFYAGLAIPQLLYNRFEAVSPGVNKGKLGFDSKQIPLHLMGGWRTDINPLFSFEPSVMLRYTPSNPVQADINAMVVYRRKIGLGLMYRTSNQLAAGLNVQVSRDWKIAYAYHTQLGGQLANFNSGSHEIGIVFGADNVRTARVNLPGQIRKYKRKQKRKSRKEEPQLNPGGKLKKQPFS